MNIASMMKRTVITVAHDASIEEAGRVMRENGIRHLPVVAGGNVVGILSDRDVALASTFTSKTDQDLGNVTAPDVSVESVMTRDPAVLQPTDSLTRAIQTCVQHKIGAFPVIERGELVGIISLIDLLEGCLVIIEGRDAE